MNMASHIMLRMSNGARAKAASLSPNHHQQQQRQQQEDEVDRVAAELKAWGIDSSSGDDDSSRRERGVRSPAVALLAALAQWVLLVVAGGCVEEWRAGPGSAGKGGAWGSWNEGWGIDSSSWGVNSSR
jgi:hypothetical protein